MRKGKFLGLGFLFLVLVFALGACSRESAPKSERPEGVQMMLGEYPFYEKGAMTDEQIKDLGLARRKLDAPLVVFNYYRGLGGKGGWQLETLPVGTEVAVDNNGRPWYKVDCGNRLYVSAETAADGLGARQGSRGSGFPWLLLLPFAALPLIWFLTRKLSGVDAPKSSTVGYIKPKTDSSVNLGASEKNQSSVVDPSVDPSLSSSDNDGPVAPVVIPIITDKKTDDAEGAQPTKTATEQENTQTTAGDATAAQSTQPTANEAAAVPVATPTVGAAINILAAHGFKTVRDIEILPNGDVSFNATVKKGE